jgi:hypothetical protein
MKILVLLISCFSVQWFWGQPPADHASPEPGFIPSMFNGNFHGQLRYHFIETDNADAEQHPYAHASGAHLVYSTKEYKHISFSIGAAGVSKLISSPLFAPESTMPVRYETGLLDLEHPGKKFMYRFEELNLIYSKDNLNVALGRQSMQTPFINPQDGRMRPTIAEAIWLQWKTDNYKIKAGWISRISPRSIYSWKSVEKSFGLLPMGVTREGKPASYAGNISSAGIGLVGVEIPINNKINLHIWEQWVQNVFHTSLLELSYPNKKEKQGMYFSGQAIRQHAINNGGNEDPAHSYFEANGRSFSFGFRSGWKSDKLDLNLNYNRITSLGKYLMPREWGREPFYTFMSRERNEGLANAHAATLGISGQFKSFKPSLLIGYFNLPDVKKFKWNKYGLPSYYQLNTELRYVVYKKCEAVFLYVYKGLSGNDHNNVNYVYNKVNMSLYDVILNFNF